MPHFPNYPPPNPGTPGWLYLLICTQSVGNLFQYVNFVPYLASGDPNPGDDPHSYLRDISFTWSGDLANWLSAESFIQFFAFYWQTALGMQEWEDYPYSGGYIGGNVPSWYAPGQLNGLVQKSSATSRRWNGRLWLPFTPTIFSDINGVLSPDGLTAGTALASRVMQPMLSNGITFTPGLWRPSVGIIEPVTEAKCCPRLGRLMCRAPHRSQWRFGTGVDLHWDY